jgi:RNA polymerase sigma-70 factor (ECF subfamily)
VLDGDVEAFAVIVNTFRNLVAADLARRLPPSDVQEVAQDAFVRAYRALPAFRGDAPVRIWLLRIARHAAMDFWRKTYRRRERLLDDLDDGPPSASRPPIRSSVPGSRPTTTPCKRPANGSTRR